MQSSLTLIRNVINCQQSHSTARQHYWGGPFFHLILIPSYCFFFSACCLLYKHHSHSLISMAAERTCKSIWLIIFTLPAEAGLSWGYLHLSLLSFFVHFNSSSYYPSNHIFTLTIALCVYAYVYTRIYIYTPLGRQ